MSFTASDIEQLRESLPELCFEAGSPVSPVQLRYLQFYGLDPAQLLKEAVATVRHCMGTIDCAGFKVACHYFFLDQARCRGTVFVLHGYYDHSGLYAQLLQYLLGKDYSVVLFDLPGHGLSSGERVSIGSFAQYREVLEALLQRANFAQLPQPWHLIGQSTGGSIAMDYSLQHCSDDNQHFKKVVLLAPLVRPHQWWRGSLLHGVLKHLVQGIPRNFVNNSHDDTFLHFLRDVDPLQSRQLSALWVSALKDWLVRFDKALPCDKALCVIQGTGDTTVDWRYNLGRIAKKFPNAAIHTVADARHHLVNESEEFRARIFRILDTLF